MRTVVTLVLVMTAAAEAAAIDPGRKVYVNKCARCHKLYDPSAYDDSRWGEWMQKMKLKAHLNDADYKRLQAYLETLRAPTAQGK